MIKEFIKETFLKWQEKGGELASDETYQARLSACKNLNGKGRPCEYFGGVTVCGVYFKEGCQVCGCPADTKFRMKSLSDSAAGLLQGGVKEIVCKHPDGNKWAGITES